MIGGLELTCFNSVYTTLLTMSSIKSYTDHDMISKQNGGEHND
nr:MAG TPA: hypothetical protein [Caudoviricetes sp.]